MKSRVTQLLFLSLCLPAVIAGTVRGQNADGPLYAGKPLSVWGDQVLALNRLARIVNTNYEAVRAMRTIGTNAIPWLLAEMAYRAPQTNQDRPPAWVGVPAGSEGEYHQLRARAGFWALGETAKPAIPGLMSLLEQQPDLAPSALAGVGAPALPALERCLANISPSASSHSHAKIVESVLGGLYVAIDVGRISRSEASFLLPAVRQWHTNRATFYWADGVLREFTGER